MTIRNIALWIALPVLSAVGVYLAFGPSGDGRNRADDGKVMRVKARKDRIRDARKTASGLRITEDAKRRALEKELAEAAKKGIGVSEGKDDRPDIITKEEEEKLSASEREVIGQLRGLLADLSLGRKALSTRLSKILEQLHGGKGSVALRKAVLETIRGLSGGMSGVGGGLSTGEALMEFLADADPEISQSALEMFIEAVNDFTLGDRDRAQLVIAASMTLNDESSVDWVLSEVYNMRHSVAIGTMNSVKESGSDMAKKKIDDVARFYTGEENITTPEQKNNWLAQNPDGAEDELFYGRQSQEHAIILED